VGLSAHGWVRDGNVGVVNCEIASRYAVLATFPPECGEDPPHDEGYGLEFKNLI
jgi:hypothetical protein